MPSVSAKLEKIRQRSTGQTPPRRTKLAPEILEAPSIEPYIGRLERFELFSTNQCYYIIGSNKLNTAYRIIKIDRTLIEWPAKTKPAQEPPLPSNDSMADNSHTAKPTLRPLSDFVTEDPNIYSQEEIRDMLDMIHDGNRMTQMGGTAGSVSSRNHGGGLKPIVKAYGIVGFIRFLDCYYLTMITKRAKCGSIGGNGIYAIKVCLVFLSPFTWLSSHCFHRTRRRFH